MKDIIFCSYTKTFSRDYKTNITKLKKKKDHMRCLHQKPYHCTQFCVNSSTASYTQPFTDQLWPTQYPPTQHFQNIHILKVHFLNHIHK